MTKNNIEKLKKELREKYERYRAVSPGYDCGHELTKHINAEYSNACAELNVVLDQLARIDPATPKKRF